MGVAGFVEELRYLCCFAAAGLTGDYDDGVFPDRFHDFLFGGEYRELQAGLLYRRVSVDGYESRGFASFYVA